MDQLFDQLLATFVVAATATPAAPVITAAATTTSAVTAAAAPRLVRPVVAKVLAAGGRVTS